MVSLLRPTGFACFGIIAIAACSDADDNTSPSPDPTNSVIDGGTSGPATGDASPNGPVTNPGVDADAAAEDAGQEAGEDASASTDAGPDLPTCGVAGWTKGISNKTITVNGTSRSYQLYVPSTYDGHKTYPLVLAFHGDGGNGAGIRSSFGLEAVAAEKGIFVYPNGINGTWDTDTLAGLTRDVAFVDAMVSSLSQSHCVTPGKVFATGMSRGAYFTNQMVCRSSTTWGAIATHSGGGPWAVVNSEYDTNGNLKCNAKSLPALQVQGLADTVVEPGEGEKARNFWRVADGCTTSTQAYAPSPCAAYKGCSKPEIYCAIPNLTHTFWSNAAQVTWSFFTTP